MSQAQEQSVSKHGPFTEHLIELWGEFRSAGQTPAEMLSLTAYLKRHLVFLILVTLTVFFSINVVLTVHEQRKMFQQHQQLLKEAHLLEVEWGQLTAELGTWAQNNRVDHLAVEKLNMKAPTFEEIEFIQ